MTEPSHAVFLSYASQDAEAAQRICDALRAGGVEVWFDQSELRGGDAWDRQIRKQIHDCALFMPIISAHSQARLEGYFRREWKLAADRTHDMAAEKAFLVPVVIDGTPERGASVPDVFHELQWTRLPGGETPPAFVERVSRLLSSAHAEASQGQRLVVDVAQGGPNQRRVRETGLPRQWRPATIFAAAAVLLVLGYVAIDRLWLSKRNVPSPSAATLPTLPGAEAQSSIPDKSIAVLPFVDLSEKHDQEYFGDGMAEEILDLLAKVPGLAVIGRTSSFQFKGKNEDLRAIGSKLNAAHVLEGSVRNYGDRVRITAQLVSTQTGAHEWSETYDRQSGDVLKLQDEIAAAVVRELQLTVAPGVLQSHAAVKSSAAYDLMLQGRHAADRWDREGLDEAVTLFKQALNLDTSSADAAAGLAFAYESQGEEYFLPPAAAFEQARHAANTALKLDPNCVLAHVVLGNIHTYYDWDWVAAEQEYQQVARLAPGSADASFGQGALSMAFGRWDDALRQIKTALARDPVRPAYFYDLAELEMRRGHQGEAEAAIRTALDIRPTYDWARWLLGLVLLARADRNAALMEMEQVNQEDARQSGLAIIYSALGKKMDSDAALARLLKDQTSSPYLVASVYAFRGQSDEAVQWLERAYAQKDSGLIYAKVELPLQGLQGNPGFKALLRKMNLPE